MRRVLPLVLASLALLAAALRAPAQAEPTPTIFAAASLKTVLEAAVEARGAPARLVFAGSSALARQIAAGAPADLFISAHPEWVDWLADQGALAPGAPRALASNRLVLVRPRGAEEAEAGAGSGAGSGAEVQTGAQAGAQAQAGATAGTAAKAGAGARSPAPDPPPSLAAYDLPTRLGDGRLAVALTAAVPAGRYAREALGALGLWTALAPRLVETEDVRGALALAARAEVPYALVYATDAAAEPRVAVAARVPAEAHAPILYLAAATQETPGAAAWLDWLGGPRGRALFARHGFAPPPARPAPQ